MMGLFTLALCSLLAANTFKVPMSKPSSSSGTSTNPSPTQHQGPSVPKRSSTQSSELPSHRHSRDQQIIPLDTDSGSVFTSPGVVAIQGGRWLGSEHLLNLSSNIGIYAEIVAPESLQINLTRRDLESLVSSILPHAGITVRPLLGQQSALPFLHVLVMIQSIDNGYVAYCAIRLFEQVTLSRIYLPPNVMWQAITWEKQELLITPANELESVINRTLRDIAGAFVRRYQTQRARR